jgi:hypothetical protein
MKILCLYVRHGTQNYANAPAVLDDWYARHGLLDRRTLWVIDNALPPETPPIAQAGITVRAGDNRAWEFSAWEKTLREVGATAANYTHVHFVTSAFHTLYTRYLEHFNAGMLEYVTARNACLGHIDSYDLPVAINGNYSTSWIRTCFFFLPLRVALTLPKWAVYAEPADFFTDPASTTFRASAPISPDYQRRIRAWLQGKEIGGHKWHSPIVRGSDEIARFQRKTLAIVNEHQLAISLRKLGVPLVDFCWLHSQGSSYAEMPEPPCEREQLTVRRRILGIPEATA